MILLLSSILFSLTLGEPIMNPDSIAAKQCNEIRDLYLNVMSQSDEIIQGREYNYRFNPHVSSPLIPKNPLPTASAIVQGKKYENIMLLYDTHQDLLVYPDPNNVINHSLCPIAVNRLVIDEFSLNLSGGLTRFKYFKFPEEWQSRLANGFYEIVSEGKCRFIIKHSSEIHINEGRQEYVYKMNRYVINGGEYYRIKGKRTLLKALRDHRDEVENYLRVSGILVRSASKNQIEDLLNYYNTLPR